MKKAIEYQSHAAECRALALGVPAGLQREQLLVMAENWERLARERTELIGRYPELALEDAAAEDGSPADSRSVSSIAGTAASVSRT